MGKNRTTLITIACGALCALCVALFMLNVQREADAARADVLARYGGEQVEVCVATRDIAAGERLDTSAVEARVWVADLLPEDPVRSTSEAVGKTAASAIGKGEVVTKKRFEGERSALDVPSGKSAVSVPAKAVRAVGGAIQPSMLVDVYASGSSETVLLAHDVLVLDSSVKSSSSLTSGDGGWITLAVDPERVEEVVSASAKTDLYFVLPGQRVEEVADGELSARSDYRESSPNEGRDGAQAVERETLSNGSQQEGAEVETAGEDDS